MKCSKRLESDYWGQSAKCGNEAKYKVTFAVRTGKENKVNQSRPPYEAFRCEEHKHSGTVTRKVSKIEEL